MTDIEQMARDIRTFIYIPQPTAQERLDADTTLTRLAEIAEPLGMEVKS